MKNERLLIVTVCVAIGSGCLAFGLDAEEIQTVDITDQVEVLETVKTVKTVKAGNPTERDAIVVEINETGMVIIDVESGEIYFWHGKIIVGSIEIGDSISIQLINTPNGKIVTRINGRN
jgi:NMD protein affecting ribosome stability and mRNA decay